MKNVTDEYGFFSATVIGLNMFDGLSRASGRTTRLVERVEDGDQIVCPTTGIANHVSRMLHDAGKKKVRVFSVPVSSVPMSRVGTSPNGRTFFDHTWVSDFLLCRLNEAKADLNVFSREMSKSWPDVPQEEPSRQLEYMDRDWVRKR